LSHLEVDMIEPESSADAQRRIDIDRLLAEAAIARVLHRYCFGADRADEAALRSVYHEDGIDEHGTNFVGTGWDFAAYTCRLALEAPHFTTMQHHITAMNIAVHGAVAAAETYVLALHVPVSGDQIAMVGGRYLDRFECRDGEWRIAYRRFVHDLDVQLPPERAFAEGIGTYVEGRRTPSDESYALFSAVADGRPWPT